MRQIRSMAAKPEWPAVFQERGVLYGLRPDPVIEAYKKDVDRTLLRANLRLTVEERIRRHQQLLEFAMELRRAGRNTR